MGIATTIAVIITIDTILVRFGVMMHITGGYLDARICLLLTGTLITTSITATRCIVYVNVDVDIVGVAIIGVDHGLLLRIVPTSNRTDRIAIDVCDRWHVGRDIVHRQWLYHGPVAWNCTRLVLLLWLLLLLLLLLLLILEIIPNVGRT